MKNVCRALDRAGVPCKRVMLQGMNGGQVPAVIVKPDFDGLYPGAEAWRINGQAARIADRYKKKTVTSWATAALIIYL